MKLTAIILLPACMAASAAGFTQGVTLSLRDVSIETAFKEIKKQTGYDFLYGSKMLNVARPVSIDVKNATLEQVLAQCFKNQPLSYKIVDKTIVIIPKEQSPDPSASPRTGSDDNLPPPIDVKGRIVNENGEPVIATISVKGTSKATSSDENGYFILRSVDDNAVLVVSATNIETKEISLNGRTDLAVVPVKIKIENLQEITINKGYYTEKQKFSAGNVGKVTAKDIEKQPVQNPLLALQGRVPGLVITQANGIPNGGVTVRIQGQNSIANGNDPLIIIDGVPYFSQLPTSGFDGILGASGAGGNMGNPLSFFNLNDIESMEVLKDADATAIYGSRAANGAILITTKKGKAGQMKFDVNANTGWGKVAHQWQMLNTRQYLDMRYEALKNDGINLASVSNTNASYYDLKVWDTTRYTDWQKLLIGGTARYNNLNATVSGGNSLVQYLVSGTYNKQTTVFPGDFNDQKASIHFNLTSSSPNKRFVLSFGGNYSLDDNKLLGADLTSYAIQTEPIAPAPYNPDGRLNWAPDPVGNSTWIVTNPLAELLRAYHSKTNVVIANLAMKYSILPGLDISNNVGFNRIETNDFSGTPMTYYRPERRATSLRQAYYGDRDLNSIIVEPQINYNKRLSKGIFDILIGGTLNQTDSKEVTLQGKGYNSDDVLENTNASTSLLPVLSLNNQYKYNALFSRLNYNWSNKYVINLTARRDGSSRFGQENQFHNFGSIGGVWIFTEEPWMKKQSFLSFGKLRASYGTSGNDGIGDYVFMSLYNFVSNSGIPYQSSVGTKPSNLPNPYIQWEETRKLSGGIDLGFLADRIMLSATFSRNRSGNQLLSYALPSITGFSSYQTNFPALVQNSSWELMVSTVNLQRKSFQWNSNFNLTIPKNQLVSFPNLSTSSYSNSLVVGKPITITKTYKYAGVNPATGIYQYFDNKGNPTLSPAIIDLTAIINTSPDFYGGLQNNIQFKGIELDFLFQFVRQLGLSYSFFNGGSRFPGQFLATRSNQPVSVLERWQNPGDVSTIGRFTTGYNGYRSSTFSYTDASYVRLKNLSLSWTLPVNWYRKIGIKDWKVYAQGQNLLTITKYNGLDPESQSVTTLPPLRVWTMGLRVGL